MTAQNRTIIGTYRGFYRYTKSTNPPHQFEFQIDTCEGYQFHGSGTDSVGDFAIFGTYQLERMEFRKIYDRRDLPEVNYVGDFSLAGDKISGNWQLPDVEGTWEAKIIASKKQSSASTVPAAPSSKKQIPLAPSAPPPAQPTNEPSQEKVDPPAPAAPILKLPQADDGLHCSNCGAVRGDFNFCLNCGHAFSLG